MSHHNLSPTISNSIPRKFDNAKSDSPLQKSTPPPTTYHLPPTNHGFTLVEMLIIAPIVILVIGVFVNAIITMTGDVLASRGASALQYDIQSALDRINSDVKISGGYLATNSVTLASPQGYNNDLTAFHNADATNGTMLILKTYATTANPMSETRDIMYLSGQPSACNSPEINQNTPMMLNVVYFVKSVDGVSSLWKRTVAPSNYETIGCNGGSIGIPWQQPTCAPNQTGTICKTKDAKLVDYIQPGDFTLNYYPTPGSTTPNTIANNSGQTASARQTALRDNDTVEVTITVTKTISGRDITRNGTTRSTSPNDNT